MAPFLAPSASASSFSTCSKQGLHADSQHLEATMTTISICLCQRLIRALVSIAPVRPLTRSLHHAMPECQLWSFVERQMLSVKCGDWAFLNVCMALACQRLPWPSGLIATDTATHVMHLQSTIIALHHTIHRPQDHTPLTGHVRYRASAPAESGQRRWPSAWPGPHPGLPNAPAPPQPRPPAAPVQHAHSPSSALSVIRDGHAGWLSVCQ